MKKILWFMAIVAFLVWAMGLMGLGAGMLLGTSIHMLLLVPLVVVFYDALTTLRRNS